MKWIVFKKREELSKKKSLLTLLKNDSVNSLNNDQLNNIRGGDGDMGEDIPLTIKYLAF